MVSRGKVLELLRPNESGKLQIVISTEVFGCIRSLAAFRMTGAQMDYIVIGSDSGRIVILKVNKDKNLFQKVHQASTSWPCHQAWTGHVIKSGVMPERTVLHCRCCWGCSLIGV